MPLPQTNINAFTGMNAPTRADPDNFDGRAEDSWNRLKSSQAQFNTLAGQVNTMADSANASASAADQDRIDAQQARADAQQARTDAQQARNTAQNYRNEAEGFRNTALTAVDSLTATSTTSNVIGVASKSWSGAGLAGKSFKVGQRLRAVNPANVAQWMEGLVTGYTNNGASSSITLSITDVSSATAGNTAANWSITIAGERGQTGPTGGLSGGNATGAVNLKQAPSVPLSANPDIWSGAGNLVVLDAPTAGVTVVDFPDAPQVGAGRTVISYGQPYTLASSNDLIVYGGTQTIQPGDLLDVICEERVSKFRVTVRRRDGTPVAHDRGALHNLRVFGASGIFYATKTGWHKITVVGASGSSGIAAGLSGGCAGATGAGAGGIISGMRWLTAGTAYIVTAAAGPAAPGQLVLSDAASAGLVANGNTADITQFSGPGITSLTANGGYGGQASVTPGATIQGGTGGSAYGAAGDFTSQGGNGGSVTLGTSDCAAASGGGAVALRGLPMHGGNATTIGAGHSAAAGGAGVGGRGGNATCSSTTNTASSGGGSAGPAADITDSVGTASQAGYNFQGTNGGGHSYGQPNDLESATGGGQQAWLASGTPSEAANGGGSGGDLGGDSNHPAAAGMFAGAGGVAGRSRSGSITASPGGGYGGAPGGAAATRSSNSTATIIIAGRPGRSGGVWIEF